MPNNWNDWEITHFFGVSKNPLITFVKSTQKESGPRLASTALKRHSPVSCCPEIAVVGEKILSRNAGNSGNTRDFGSTGNAHVAPFAFIPLQKLR